MIRTTLIEKNLLKYLFVTMTWMGSKNNVTTRKRPQECKISYYDPIKPMIFFKTQIQAIRIFREIISQNIKRIYYKWYENMLENHFRILVYEYKVNLLEFVEQSSCSRRK